MVPVFRNLRACAIFLDSLKKRAKGQQFTSPGRVRFTERRVFLGKSSAKSKSFARPPLFRTFFLKGALWHPNHLKEKGMQPSPTGKI
jgi:hypothetical protein